MQEIVSESNPLDPHIEQQATPEEKEAARNRYSRAISGGQLAPTPEGKEMTEKPQQVPSVGRTVHYVANDTPGSEFPAGVHRAAIITEVKDTQLLEDPSTTVIEVSLVVFNPTDQYFNRNVRFDPTGETPGTWHWPEYVPPR